MADAEETAERPAGIAVEWVNEVDETVRIGEERSIGFRTAKSEDGSAHLLVGDGRDRDDTVSFDGCWYVSGAVNIDGSYRTVDWNRERPSNPNRGSTPTTTAVSAGRTAFGPSSRWTHRAERRDTA